MSEELVKGNVKILKLKKTALYNFIEIKFFCNVSLSYYQDVFVIKTTLLIITSEDKSKYLKHKTLKIQVNFTYKIVT